LACNTKLNRRLSGRKGEVVVRHVAGNLLLAFASGTRLSLPRCARHSTACACVLCAADGSIRSRAMCSTLRPAGAIVHDEARGEGVSYSASAAWSVASLPAGSAIADGTSVGARRGRLGGGREAAGGVHLPLSRLVLCELPTVFRELLRRAPARARLLRFSASAVRRSASGTRSCSGRPRRRRAAAAPRRRWNGHTPWPCAAACACTADGGGDSAGALNGRFAASANGAPVAVLGVHVGVGIDERSDHSAIAAFRRPVQRGGAIAVHGGAGVRGWAPRGTPVPNRYPKHKPAGSPRGSTKCSFWVTVNGREYSRGLGVVAISHRARASIKRGKLKKVAETKIAGEGGGEKL
jgi:hypothetical protein